MRILISILFLLLSLQSYSQTVELYPGWRVDVTSIVTTSDSTYNVSFNINHPYNTYNGNDVQLNDVLYTNSISYGDDCNEYVVTNIIDQFAGQLVVTVTDRLSQGIPAQGIGVLVRLSESGLTHWIANVGDPLNQCISAKLAGSIENKFVDITNQIDSIYAGTFSMYISDSINTAQLITEDTMFIIGDAVQLDGNRFKIIQDGNIDSFYVNNGDSIIFVQQGDTIVLPTFTDTDTDSIYFNNGDTTILILRKDTIFAGIADTTNYLPQDSFLVSFKSGYLYDADDTTAIRPVVIDNDIYFQLNEEAVEDVVAEMFNNQIHENITITYDDSEASNLILRAVDTSGRNQSLTITNDTLFLTDTDTTLKVLLPQVVDTDTDTDSIYVDNDGVINLITRGDTIVLPVFVDTNNDSIYFDNNGVITLAERNDTIVLPVDTNTDTDTLYFNLGGVLYQQTRNDTLNIPVAIDTSFASNDTLFFVSAGDTTTVVLSVPGDKWGDQVVISDSTLSGQGTVQSPLTVNYLPDLVFDGDSSVTNELQDIDSVTLVNDTLTVYISNGQSSSVDLSGYSPTDRADTSGYNLTFYISNDSLNLTDGIGNLRVDLSPYLDNTDTDSILVDSLGTLLVKQRADIIYLIPDTDTDEQNLSLVGDSLLIDSGTGVDLSIYLDNTDTDTIIIDSAGVKTYTVTRNDTIYIPAGDGTGTDTSGYNQSFTKVGDSLILIDGATRFAVYDPDSAGGGGFVLPTDSITFNNNEAGPDSAELNWDATLGYLVFGGVGNQLIQIGQDQYWMTINQSGGPILKGEVVRAAGAIGNSGKFLIQKYLADGNTDPNYLLGVAAHDIPDGTEGYVMHQGKIRQIDLTAYSTGQVLYVSPTVAGDWVTAEPSNGYQKLPIAFVVDSSANGTLAVRVKTGEALRDLHDVDVSSPADGSLIAYDSVLGYWVTKADSVIDDDADSLNEIQVISKSNDTVYLSKNGGFILDSNIDSFYINYYGVTTRVAQGDTFYISSEGIYPDGYVHCGTPTVVNPVTSTTGAVWMDRNLGASQVATSSTDANSYGDLYQWGRFAEGHQCRDSDTTSVNATTAVPNDGNTWDGKFILDASDWLTVQDDNLWQGVNGVNNPCPSGYRLPTATEFNAELLSWSSNNSAGAFASSLKLPVSGYRLNSSGNLNAVGSVGYYWISSVSGSFSRSLYFSSGSDTDLYSNSRAYAFTVRCIKETTNIDANGIYDIRNDSSEVRVKEIGITEQLSFDNSTLVIDGENNRVGIGTASPSEVLDVVGDVEIDGKLDLNDGGNSVFIGDEAGSVDDASDNRNVGVGYQALRFNTTGYYNTATGYQALFSNTTGYQNTATGIEALYSNTIGGNNTATGFKALMDNVLGARNVALGWRAGRFFGTSGFVGATKIDNSILIGYDSRPKADFEGNQIVIGYEGRGEGSNTIKIGNSSHTGAYIEGIYGQTTGSPPNVHITADGRLMESTVESTLFDTLYSVGDSLIFVTPAADTFIVTFQTQTDDWGNQVVQTEPTLDGTGVTGNLLTLAQQSATDGQVLKWVDSAATWLPANDIDTDTNTDEQDIDGLTFDTLTGSLTVGITGGSGQTIDLDGRYLITEVDGNVTNELQDLSLFGDSIKISNGTGVDISAYLDNTDTDSILVDSLGTILVKNRGDVITLIADTDEQNLSLVSDSLLIDRGAGVDLSVYLDNTDNSGYNSSLSLSNDTLYLTDDNSTLQVYIPSAIDTSFSSSDTLFIVSAGDTSSIVLAVPGDNWGADTVVSNETLTGNGTASSPLSVVFPADEVYDGDSSITNELQNLSIDSTGRVFTVSIQNGNSVSFEDQVDDADASATNEAWTIRDDAANTDLISNGTVFFNGVGNITTALSETSPGFFTLDISSSETSELQTLNAGDYMQVTGDGINTDWEVTFDMLDIALGTHVILGAGTDRLTKYPNNLYQLNSGDPYILIYDTIPFGSSVGWIPTKLSNLPSELDDQQLGWTQDTGLLTLTNSSNVTIEVYDGITRGLVPDSISGRGSEGYFLNMDGTWKVPVDNNNYVESITMLDPEDDDTWRITLNRSGVLADAIEDVDLSKYLDNTDTQDLGWTQSTGVLTLQSSPSVTIDNFNGTTRGLVPDSDNSTSKYLRADGTWVTPPDNNTQLSNEQVQDIVGGMVQGNTQTGITVTYQDVDGTIDFDVADESATNEIQNLSLNVYEDPNIVEWDLSLSPNAVDVQLKGEGIIDFQTSPAAGFGEVIISAVEIDGDSTNELQTIDTFGLNGTTLSLSLDQDGEAAKTVSFTGWDNNASDDITSVTSGVGLDGNVSSGNATLNLGYSSLANAQSNEITSSRYLDFDGTNGLFITRNPGTNTDTALLTLQNTTTITSGFSYNTLNFINQGGGNTNPIEASIYFTSLNSSDFDGNGILIVEAPRINLIADDYSFTDGSTKIGGVSALEKSGSTSGGTWNINYEHRQHYEWDATMLSGSIGLTITNPINASGYVGYYTMRISGHNSDITVTISGITLKKRNGDDLGPITIPSGEDYYLAFSVRGADNSVGYTMEQ